VPPPSPKPAVDLRLSTPVAELAGVSKARQRGLRRLGLRSVADLLRHYPTRYEHEAAEASIIDLVVGQVGTARGVVEQCRWVGPPYGRRGRFEAVLADDTGKLQVAAFNQRWLADKVAVGATVRVQGKVKAFRDVPQMANPKWEFLADDDEPEAATERYRPVYPATEDLPSSAIEQLVAAALPAVVGQVPDPLPPELLADHAMPAMAQALRMVHRPANEDEAKAGRRRLKYNELLLLNLAIAARRAYTERRLIAPALTHNDAIDRHIRERFPFELTDAQARVVGEIAADLRRTVPMNRLLQGDVGAGKTVVALYAMLMAVADRKQAALMAPTELLAEQHHGSITAMLEGSNVRVELLTGSTAPAGSPERRELRRRIAEGEVDLVVGTHALASEHVRFHDLAVAVVDEQHRFGVRQRAAFRSEDVGSTDDAPPAEAGSAETPHTSAERASARGSGAPEPPRTRTPHRLVMTATPIPRTLSLTVFGDLDVSTIKGLPPGRIAVTNRAVTPDQADEVYRYLRTRLERGEQGFVVVPAIDSEGQPTDKQLRSVRQHAKLLRDKFLRGFEVATVHGQLKRITRERVMDRFRRGKVAVLVATTVIEVGVDVPNATVMIVEHAERFGLAQLHQLRGRVGRGASGRRPLCVFIAEPTTEVAEQRIAAIASTNDGFKVAEMDLEIRGMGEILGTKQHGLPPLRLASIPDDMDLLNLARRDADALIAADPELSDPDHAPLRKVLLREYGEGLGLVDVG